MLGARTQFGVVTAYCQHDPTTGALRWREVSDGGGCLSRRLRGVGVDGRLYACRLFPDGFERWVAVR